MVGGAEGASDGDSLGLHVGNAEGLPVGYADNVGDALGHTKGVGREAKGYGEIVDSREHEDGHDRLLHAVGLVEGVSDGGIEGKLLGSPVGIPVVGT